MENLHCLLKNQQVKNCASSIFNELKFESLYKKLGQSLHWLKKCSQVIMYGLHIILCGF